MKKLRIGYDMDGIIVNLLGSWLKVLNHRHQLDATFHDIRAWDVSLCEKLRHIPRQTVFDVLGEDGFYENAEPIPGALLSISALHAIDGHESFIVTATAAHKGTLASQRVQDQKRRWRDKMLPFINDDHIIFETADRKHEHKFDVFVEDRPETLLKYAATHRDALVCGIKYPYNEHLSLDATNAIILVNDCHDTIAAWGRLVALIRSYARVQENL